MCGILAVLCRSPELSEDLKKIIEKVLKARGPDVDGVENVQLQDGYHLYMASWVLHLRGPHPVQQPCRNKNGDLLQWNGDVFGGIVIGEHECDTVVLAEELAKCQVDEDVCELMTKIQGPWSFVFYQKSTGKLWFGRDYFGRRSLLWRHHRSEFVLSSVAVRPGLRTEGTEWQEVPADGLYCMDLQKIADCPSIKCHPWASITNQPHSKINTAQLLNLKYSNSLLDRFWDGGMASLMVPRIQPFVTPVGHQDRLEFEGTDTEILVQICDHKNMWSIVDAFVEVLGSAVQKRVVNVPPRCGNASSIGVLFSGGIDCTVIALLADRYVPGNEPIDLLNVAFEQRAKRKDEIVSSPNYKVPDRLTGLQSFSELRQLCPTRRWNFVEINVTVEELQSKRKQIIADLTYPLTSVLDDSIGCAVWFATRGTGFLTVGDEFRPYSCKAKVLLCGMGADEQLGGYSRHRSAFERTGWPGVANEIKMEIERISSRNLGRDNRIIADHGRDARLPYLDENVVSFLNQTPLRYKTDFNFKRGIGEKLLLRAAAHVLGLRGASTLPKRAIQFGSRIAKAECRKEKAGDVCSRLSVER